nr:hypothetical protein [Tanacetum cinerariifolium]
MVSGLLVYELPLSSLRKKYRLNLKNDMPPQDKKWEISGIPCKHAIVAIHDMTYNGYDIGRPPKKRKKSKGEIVMVKGNKIRQGKIVTCSLCQAAVHNKRSCSSVAGPRNESVPKKTTGTKRTSSVTGTSIATAEVGTQASQAVELVLLMYFKENTLSSYYCCIPQDWVHNSYKLQTWMNVYSHKIGRPPKKRKKSKGEIVMVKGNKTRQGKIVTCSLCQAVVHNKRSCSSVAGPRNESVPKKTTRTKRTSSVTGTSIATAEVGTQASQA